MDINWWIEACCKKFCYDIVRESVEDGVNECIKFCKTMENFCVQ
jgi:hypothetical protein